MSRASSRMALGPEDVHLAVSSAAGSVPPDDRAWFVYRACFFLGAGILFPWNSYITAVDYFERVHPGKHVDRVFGVLYFLPNLLSLMLVLRFGFLVPPGVRVRLGFGLFLVCLLVPAFFSANLGVLCVGIALNGVADAVAQGSLFALVASMPTMYTQALMGGTSLSGLIVSILRILTKASFPSTESGAGKSAAVYFVVAALWVLACVYVYGQLEKSEVYRWHRANARSKAALEEEEDEYESERSLTGIGRRIRTPRLETRISRGRGGGCGAWRKGHDERARRLKTGSRSCDRSSTMRSPSPAFTRLL